MMDLWSKEAIAQLKSRGLVIKEKTDPPFPPLSDRERRRLNAALARQSWADMRRSA